MVVESAAALETAQNRGVSEESLRLQFGRLGNTPYELKELTLELSGSPFAPVSVLNQVRRDAVDRLQEMQSQVRCGVVREFRYRSSRARLEGAACRIASAGSECRSSLTAAIEFRPASMTLDYLDLYGLRPSIERVRQSGIAVRVASPRVLKPGEGRILQFSVEPAIARFWCGRPGCCTRCASDRTRS